MALAVAPPDRSYEGPAAVAVDSDDVPAPAPPEPPKSEPAAKTADEDVDVSRDVRVPSYRVPREDGDRAGSVVERRDLDERLVQSAPDALRYEPGVYIQQTAHGQASPFVRGQTGQQTVMFGFGFSLI